MVISDNMRCGWKHSSSQPNGEKHAPDGCKIAVWLKYHRGVNDCAIIRIAAGVMHQEHVCEASKHVKDCPIERKEDCPIGRFVQVN